MATLNTIVNPPGQTLVNGELVDLPLYKPEGAVQFGRKHFITFGDHRPLVTFPAYQDGTTKTVNMGIKPPVFPPVISASGTDALNLPASTEVFVVYAFWSTMRQTMSEISPAAHFTTAASPKQLTISGFEAPRDGAIESEIDTLLIGVQLGTSANFMCLWGVTTLTRIDYYLPAASFTLDLSGAQLASGFALDQASIYSMIPPAVRFIAKFGNRSWLAGQPVKSSVFSAISVTKAWRVSCTSSSTAGTTTLYVDSITDIVAGDCFQIGYGTSPAPGSNTIESGIVVSTTAGSPGYITTLTNLKYDHSNEPVVRVWRGQALAKATCDNALDAYMWQNLFVNDQFVGVIYDVNQLDSMWLDRDIPLSISGSLIWHVEGNNDRIWPTSYHNFTPGGIATVFPESINVADAVELAPIVDGSELLTGVEACQDSLFIPMSKTVMVMTGATAVNTPDVNIRTDFGSVGSSASGTLTQSDTAELFWISQNGFTSGQPGGIVPISANLGLLQFFRDPRWLAPADLTNMVATFTRQYSGYMLGNFTVNGNTGYWGLLSLQPQVGFWLFDGQLIASNILVYQDVNGEDVILCGDGFQGRTKELLADDSGLQDVPCVLSHPTDFVEGFQSPSLTTVHGYTTDGTFHYVSTGTVLKKRYNDPDWTVAAMNSSPFTGTTANTLYDGCYYANKLYFCAFDSSGGATSWLIVYDAGTLAILQTLEITAQIGADRALSCTVDAANEILYVLPWNTAKLYKYDLNNSLAYLSSLTLTGLTISNGSGIYLRDGLFYAIGENSGALVTITTGGVVSLLFTPASSVDSIGLDFSQSELRMGRSTLVQYFDGTPAGSDTAEDFTCMWREGWQRSKNVMLFTPKGVGPVLAGIPDPSTLEISAIFWQDRFANRNECFFLNGYALTPIDITNPDEQFDLPSYLELGDQRLASLGMAWASTAGTAIGVPIELRRWTEIYSSESGW